MLNALYNKNELPLYLTIGGNKMVAKKKKTTKKRK